MSTTFDVLTVGAFLAMAGAYVIWGRGDQRLLMQLLLSGLAFAIANQLGNNGIELFGAFVALIGAGYALISFRR